MLQFGKALLAEGIGAFALSFIGVLAITAAGVVSAPAGIANLASIGLAHCLAIAVMIAAMGAISGGHFNPAVTFGFVVTARMKPLTALYYWIAQLVGASIAGLVLVGFVGGAAVANGTPNLGTNVSLFSGIILETTMTSFPRAGDLRHHRRRPRAKIDLSAGYRLDYRPGYHGWWAAHGRLDECVAHLWSGAGLAHVEQSPGVLDRSADRRRRGGTSRAPCAHGKRAEPRNRSMG